MTVSRMSMASPDVKDGMSMMARASLSNWSAHFCCASVPEDIVTCLATVTEAASHLYCYSAGQTIDAIEQAESDRLAFCTGCRVSQKLLRQ